MKLDIRLTNYYTNMDDGGFELAIDDQDANVRLLTVKLTYEEFAKLVGTSGMINVDGALGPKERFGTKAENEVFFVPEPSSERMQRLSYKEAVEAIFKLRPDLKAEGWFPRADDYGNHHRRRTQDGVVGYGVIFYRNVDKETGKPIL